VDRSESVGAKKVKSHLVVGIGEIDHPPRGELSLLSKQECDSRADNFNAAEPGESRHYDITSTVRAPLPASLSASA
jgi:hypothetical protein